MGNAIGNFVEQSIRNFFNGGGHSIGGIHGTNDSRPAFISLIITHAYALEIRNGNEILPYFAGKIVLVKFFAKDGIGFTQRFQTIAGNGTQAAYAQTGTGERLTINHFMRQTKRFANNTDFVFVKQLHRFDQFKLHAFGQTAHVMMRLNAFGFQNIGVNRTLSKEINAFKLARFFVENFNKLGTDDLALLFGFGNIFQLAQETVGSVYI